MGMNCSQPSRTTCPGTPTHFAFPAVRALYHMPVRTSTSPLPSPFPAPTYLPLQLPFPQPPARPASHLPDPARPLCLRLTCRPRATRCGAGWAAGSGGRAGPPGSWHCAPAHAGPAAACAGRRRARRPPAARTAAPGAPRAGPRSPAPAAGCSSGRPPGPATAPTPAARRWPASGPAGQAAQSRVRARGWAPSTPAPARPASPPRAPRAPCCPRPRPRPAPLAPDLEPDPEPAAGARAACPCACAGRAAAPRVASACEPAVPAPSPPPSRRPRARPVSRLCPGGIPVAPPRCPACGSQGRIGHGKPAAGGAYSPVPPCPRRCCWDRHAEPLSGPRAGTGPGLEEGPWPEMAPPPPPSVRHRGANLACQGDGLCSGRKDVSSDKLAVITAGHLGKASPTA